MDGCPFVCFDSLSVDFVSPIGAVPAGQEITFCVRLIKRAGAHSPRLLVYEADQWENPAAILPMMPLRDEPTVVWYVTHFLPQRPSLLFYRFDAQVGDGRQSILRGDDSTGKLNPWNGKHWQLTVYDAKMRQPSALTGGLIYQIFPDRFYSSKTKKEHVPSDRILRDDWGAMPSWRPNEQGKVLCNDYFGGDLEGIREKLPYLKSLGVTVIYLNPIFEAQSNHRYNTADYTKIDPLLGSEADFKALCADARKVDISVILDGVFSHTGSDSIYFNREGRYKGGAYRDRKSPYLSWFKFEKWPESYKSWWGIDTLPEVVETDPSYLDFITGENGVIDHWMKAGAAGFRLDVADELPDLALDAICAAVRRQDAEAPVIGEVWEDASNKMSYGIRRRYLLGNQLSSVMNYPLTDAILAFVRQGDAYSLFSVLLTQQECYPSPVRHALMNSLSTHDIPRAITALVGESDAGAGREWQAAHNTLSPAQYERGKKLLRLASVLQYTLPGVPCLYYGDEAGMNGYRDPFNRGCFPWGKEDTELTDFFRTLGKLRQTTHSLVTGDFSLVYMSDVVFAYLRSSDRDILFVAVNRGEIPIPPPLPCLLPTGDVEVVLGDVKRLVLPGLDALVWRYPKSRSEEMAMAASK